MMAVILQALERAIDTKASEMAAQGGEEAKLAEEVEALKKEDKTAEEGLLCPMPDRSSSCFIQSKWDSSISCCVARRQRK